jgi:Putative adhesin
MPVFATPEPISVVIELGAGAISLIAGDRAETTVTVLPSDPSSEADVRTAERTKVDFTGGVLTVKGPHNRLDFSSKIRSIDLRIELPTGSSVESTTAVGDHQCSGALGECRLRSSAGDIRVEQTGPLTVHTSAGRVTAGRIAGPAEITTGSGVVRVAAVDGSLRVKNSNGLTEIGDVTGEVTANSANGDIVLGRVSGSRVAAKTANGAVRIESVGNGEVDLRTAMGDLEIGVVAGLPTWLDVHTKFGRVRNELDGTGSAPAPGQPSVQIRANTAFGDITVRRS